MQRFSFGFKYLAMIFIGLSITACNDIPRDNLLDPKNPGSYRQAVIMVEAFVNTENDQRYNENMISALNTLKRRYPSKVVVAHYHRNTTGFTDSLIIPDTENLYEQYLDYYNGEKGAPDVFINGAYARVQGATSADNALERLEDVLTPLRVQNAYFTIEPEITFRNGTVNLAVVIARLGGIYAEELLVHVTIVETIDDLALSAVARHHAVSNLIPQMTPGEQLKIELGEYHPSGTNPHKAIFKIVTNASKQVQQAVEVNL
ncbi:MAG: hypothetical protein E4H13_02460 [Calditrichales bacterium]|nr:MAG: hypothetical protein E4H13_02460 [Calditrichales bacterium]